MGQVAERVRARFPDTAPEHISSMVEQLHRQYDGRPIREFVPVLVEREVIEKLRLDPATPVIPTQSRRNEELLPQ